MNMYDMTYQYYIQLMKYNAFTDDSFTSLIIFEKK